MEEQQLNPKQIKTVKTVRGLSLFAFVFLLIIVCMVFLYFAFQQKSNYLFEALYYIASTLGFYFILYVKNENRAKTIALALFIIILVRICFANLIRLSSKQSLIVLIILIITAVLSSIIEIVLSWQLYKKARNKTYNTKLAKPFIIVYGIALAVRLSIIPFTSSATGTIIAGIIIDFIISLFFFLFMYIIYKGLTDDFFYEKIIMSRPHTMRPLAQTKAASVLNPGGYCYNCGYPLSIGDRYCAKCGKPVAPSSPPADNN